MNGLHAQEADRNFHELSARVASSERVTIAGVGIDALDFDTVVERVIAYAGAGGAPAYVVTPNAQHVVLFQRDLRLQAIYARALLSVADGVPLLWAAALLGEPLPGRVNGTDLFEALCRRAAGAGLRVFLLGGRPGAADAAAARLRERNPGLAICGAYCPPYGFERDPAENAKILAAIEAARPDILFVGLGAPKQEYWMSGNLERLRVPISLGIGVSFELVGGVVRRAPRWMQRSGLEWLYRLGSEPGRLWQRYIFGNARFCWLVARQFATRSRKPQK